MGHSIKSMFSLRYLHCFILALFLFSSSYSRVVYSQPNLSPEISTIVVSALGTFFALGIVGAATGGRSWFFLYKQFPIVRTEHALDRAEVRMAIVAATGLRWEVSKRVNEDLFSDEYHNTLQIKYKRNNKHRLRLAQPKNNSSSPLNQPFNYNKPSALVARKRRTPHKFITTQPLVWLEKVRDILLDLDKKKKAGRNK